MFTEIIERDGGTGRRFEYIGDPKTLRQPAFTCTTGLGCLGKYLRPRTQGQATGNPGQQ